jgi:hypothetical protein
MPATGNPGTPRSFRGRDQLTALFAESGQTASLFCKVEEDSSGGALEYTAQATVTSGSAYVGNVSVSFYSSVPGQIFPDTELSPDTTVTSDRPWIIWQPVPAADIGASAEPVGCTASGG